MKKYESISAMAKLLGILGIMTPIVGIFLAVGASDNVPMLIVSIIKVLLVALIFFVTSHFIYLAVDIAKNLEKIANKDNSSTV